MTTRCATRSAVGREGLADRPGRALHVMRPALVVQAGVPVSLTREELIAAKGWTLAQADALLGGDVYDESEAMYDRYDQAEAEAFSSWRLGRYGEQSGQVAQVLDLREVLRLLAELMHCYPTTSR